MEKESSGKANHSTVKAKQPSAKSITKAPVSETMPVESKKKAGNSDLVSKVKVQTAEGWKRSKAKERKVK